MSATYITQDGQLPLEELRALPEEISAGSLRLRRRWRGHPDKILEQRAALVATGAYTRLRVTETSGNGLFWLLEAEVSGDVDAVTGEPIAGASQAVSVTWTSEPATFTKSVWDLPVIRRQLDLLGTAETNLVQRQLVKTYAEALLRGETQVPDVTDATATLDLSPTVFLDLVAASGLDRETWAGFLRLLFAGVTSWQPNSWTLRRTRRVPPGNSFKESSSNVGRMLTYSSLQGLEGFTTESLATDLPTEGYWLKQAPVDRPGSDGAREVTTDFWWTEEFADFVFGAAV